MFACLVYVLMLSLFKICFIIWNSYVFKQKDVHLQHLVQQLCTLLKHQNPFIIPCFYRCFDLSLSLSLDLLRSSFLDFLLSNCLVMVAWIDWVGLVTRGCPSGGVGLDVVLALVTFTLSHSCTVLLKSDD